MHPLFELARSAHEQKEAPKRLLSGNDQSIYSAASFSLAAIFSLMRADLPERPRM
jgi:hypothetical protein